MVRIVLVLIIFFTMPAFGQYIPKFDLQGHRGARGLLPENTIAGFLKALDYGVTTVELDLAVTKDGYLVVSHEPWMASGICMTPEGNNIPPSEDEQYNIYQMTYAEVSQFDCGSMGNKNFPLQQKIKSTKPLLVDVIIAIEDHIKSWTLYQVDYNIEIKSWPEGDDKYHPEPNDFSDMVYSLLNQYLPMNRVVIQSFDFRALKYFHERYPQVRLSALVENRRSVDSNLAELGFVPSIYSPDFKTLTLDKVNYLHKKSIRVIPWTVNDVADMQRMVAWHVDGIITDYPDRARSIGLGLKLNK